MYILEKLERDKYIFKMENNTYHITSEGKIFWLKGGYLNSYQQDKFLFERQENDRMMGIRNEKILSMGSVGAMIGAIGVLIWEIGKTLYHFLCDY